MIISNIRNNITKEKLELLLSSDTEVIENLIYDNEKYFIFSNKKFNHIKFINCSFKNISFSYSEFERCKFINCDMMFSNFINSKFNKCKFKNCDINTSEFGGSFFNDCKLKYLNMFNSNFRSSEITNSIFDNVDLSHSNIEHSIIININFIRSNLTRCSFCCSKFKNTKFNLSNLQNTNFSRSVGLLNPIDYLSENFEWDNNIGGMIVYKLFDYFYSSVWPAKQFKKPGDIIIEEPNYDRAVPCSCGVNVGNRKWFQENKYINNKFKNQDFWKCLIKFKWLSGVVVPYGTDGQIRCCKLELIKKLSDKELYKFYQE